MAGSSLTGFLSTLFIGLAGWIGFGRWHWDELLLLALAFGLWSGLLMLLHGLKLPMTSSADVTPHSVYRKDVQTHFVLGLVIGLVSGLFGLLAPRPLGLEWTCAGNVGTHTWANGRTRLWAWCWRRCATAID